jgi:hypothetical protein
MVLVVGCCRRLRDEEGCDPKLLAASNANPVLIDLFAAWDLSRTDAMLLKLAERARTRQSAKLEAIERAFFIECSAYNTASVMPCFCMLAIEMIIARQPAAQLLGEPF